MGVQISHQDPILFALDKEVGLLNHMVVLFFYFFPGWLPAQFIFPPKYTGFSIEEAFFYDNLESNHIVSEA